MGENTKIEWATHTFNPWIGCTEVSPACANCYARTLAERYGWAEWGEGNERHRTSEANWRKPLAWDRAAAKSGERPRVFCASLADFLDDRVPKQWRHDLFDLIERTPNLDWLLLTKRTESYYLKLPHSWTRDPLPQVWLGATVESDRYLWRADSLREVPAAVHFLSCEPLLSDISGLDLTNIQWVIAGGESGAKARPTHPDWFRSLRDKCNIAGASFLFKQHGNWLHESQFDSATDGASCGWSCHLWADASMSYRLSKAEAGRLLDGREWNELPTPATVSA